MGEHQAVKTPFVSLVRPSVSRNPGMPKKGDQLRLTVRTLERFNREAEGVYGHAPG